MTERKSFESNAIAPDGWTVLARLGGGASFVTWCVRDRRGREAVLRRASGATDAEAALARHDEVLRTLGLVSGIPRRIGGGQDAAGAYLLESVAPGRSLRRLVTQSGRGLPAAVALGIAARAFAELAALHGLSDARGPLRFVHADLCPDHLFVAPTPEEGVTFIDFGWASVRGLGYIGAPPRGTLPFVAPERARGEGAPEPAADVYALAATMLYALHGASPVSSGPAALVQCAERGLDPAVPPGTPAGFGRALRAGLAFRASERASASEMAELLGHA
ncbi:MAG: phosphotransferase [Myxococcota bacterium]